MPDAYVYGVYVSLSLVCPVAFQLPRLRPESPVFSFALHSLPFQIYPALVFGIYIFFGCFWSNGSPTCKEEVFHVSEDFYRVPR